MTDLTTNNIAPDNLFTDLTDAFGKYLVAPLNAFGLGGFVFDIEGEAVTTISTDITDHYLEDNTAVQDHIAVRPKRVTLGNYVGELVFRRDSNTNTTLQKVVQKLTILNQYLPDVSKGVAQAQKILAADNPLQGASDLLSQSNISLPDIADLWSLTKNLNSAKSKQQQAYQYFDALAQQKILIGIQTPHEFLANMAIETIIARQDAVTKDITEFSITLKQMRFAQVGFAPFDKNQFQDIAAAQSTPVTFGGNTQGTSATADPKTVYNSGKLS